MNDEENQIGIYQLLLKATAAAMKAVPSANAAWMDSVVRVYDSIDINVVAGWKRQFPL
jgi:pyruvate dehydrogenase E2 component (dihydrolipoamide acetyltransferase)